ncbi:MAG: epimerase [Proteobacteria bacterium]|nr:epimerase [Pseudomonadota bacterium]
MKQLVFVVGATGYTGRAVVQQLSSANIPVVAHIRSDSPKGEHWKKSFEQQGAIVEQTSWEESVIQEALMRHEPTHVFSLLGTTKAKNRKEAQRGNQANYEVVDKGLSLLLLRCASKIKNKPKFVFLSSMGVVENTKNAYLRARADVEREIKASELPWLIAQPAFISGADRDEFRPMERFGAIVSDGILSGLSFVGAGGLKEKYASLTSEQLAAGLIAWGVESSQSSRTLSAEDLRRRPDQNK